ncbi:hypothetical protein PR003_g2887 [Phytophthora rubi]|uniref:SWIM-type domain-containing protein n=1 Tax=Phytophthora rubi TaxID=129364 RepID=A0A6A4FX40_9STRA|nr:hypothetical protein PR003_g2887 [Phytophthora rubi]
MSMEMATRARSSSTQKRPLPADSVDDSKEEVSDAGERLPSSSPSRADSAETTSSASEPGERHTVIPHRVGRPSSRRGRLSKPIWLLTKLSRPRFSINACVQAVDKANKTIAIKITKCCLEHKHNLSEYVFKGHSSKRMSLDETTLKTVDELRKAGAKKSSVLKFIADNSQVPGCAQPASVLPEDLSEDESVLELAKQSPSPFIRYFMKNWDNCRELWCAHKRQNTATLGKNTINRLEASWKEWVDYFMAVDECIASIMYYQSLQERRFMEDVNKKVNVYHTGYDREMILVANLVSEHACELIHEQYAYALSKSSYECYEGCPEVYFVNSMCKPEYALDELNAEYSVTKRDWKCSCLFMSTRLLPCRHVFYVRKNLAKETVIPTQLLNPRWLISTVRSALEFGEKTDSSAPVESFAIGPVLISDNRPWDSNRNYREAMPIASGICDTMAELGMVQYREALAYLHEVARKIKNGEFVRPEFLETSASVKALLVGSESGERAMDMQPNASHFEDPQNEATVQSGESGTQSSESGTQSSELDEQQGETIIDLSEQTETLTPANGQDFHLTSPPRGRGRPKQTTISKKVAQNKIAAMAQVDSDMIASNLSLADVREAVSNHPTYASAAVLLIKFKLFVFSRRPKAPIVRKISSLPPTKLITSVEAISRIFRADLIDRCEAKIIALQRKETNAGRENLGEQKVAVEKLGVGVYASTTLDVMKKWRKAMKTIRLVDKAVTWVEAIGFSMPMPSVYQVEPDPEILQKLKSIPLLSIEKYGSSLVKMHWVTLLLTL